MFTWHLQTSEIPHLRMDILEFWVSGGVICEVDPTWQVLFVHQAQPEKAILILS